MARKKGTRRRAKTNGNGNRSPAIPHLDFSTFGKSGRLQYTIAVQENIPDSLGSPTPDPSGLQYYRKLGLKKKMGPTNGFAAPSLSTMLQPQRLVAIKVCFDNRMNPLNFRAAAFLMPGGSADYLPGGAEAASPMTLGYAAPKLARWMPAVPQMSRSSVHFIKVGPEFDIGRFGTIGEIPTNAEKDTLMIVAQNYVGTIRILLRYEVLGFPGTTSLEAATLSEED